MLVYNIMNEEKQKETSTLLNSDFKVIGVENMIIPQCCREGWDSCPHVLKKPKKVKNNIGL